MKVVSNEEWLYAYNVIIPHLNNILFQCDVTRSLFPYEGSE